MRYSSSRIQQETRLVSVDSLIDMVVIGRLDPMPTFGTLPSLHSTDKSQIIESLILGIPTATVWTQQNELGKTQLLSGFDILLSIVGFKNEKFRLRKLRVLKHLEGLFYSDLEYVEKKHFMQMEINLGIIFNGSDPLLRCLFIEKINREQFGNDSSQLARNIIFSNASYELNVYSEKLEDKYNILDDYISNPKDRSRYLLRLQVEILYCLLIVYIDEEGYRLDRDVSLESYTYSRGHVSKYSNYENVDVSINDDLDNALNKVMFILEHDPGRLRDIMKILNYNMRNIFLSDFLDENNIKIIPFTCRYFLGRANKYSLFEVFYSYYLNKNIKRFRLNKDTKLHELYKRKI